MVLSNTKATIITAPQTANASPDGSNAPVTNTITIVKTEPCSATAGRPAPSIPTISINPVSPLLTSGSPIREKNTTFSYFHKKLPTSYHGTGDVFSSVCVGALNNGLSLDKAIKIAADYTVECIRITAEEKGANAYGVNFELAIPYLLSLLENEK